MTACRPDAIPPDTDVIFTTPSHQCPTNATMPMARRRALLARAREIDALIVEDDYEFEMSFLRAPSPALKSLDTRRARDLCRQLFQVAVSRSAAWLSGGVRAVHPRGPRPARQRAAPSARPDPAHRRLLPVAWSLRRACPAHGPRPARAAHGDGGRARRQRVCTIAGRARMAARRSGCARPRGSDTKILADRLRSPRRADRTRPFVLSALRTSRAISTGWPIPRSPSGASPPGSQLLAAEIGAMRHAGHIPA